jgi:hypothetical protein
MMFSYRDFSEAERDERVIAMQARLEELEDMDPASGTPECDELEQLMRRFDAACEMEAY